MGAVKDIVTVGGRKFKYQEISIGHGKNRGIQVNIDGAAGGGVKYGFGNPHGQAYSNDPPTFYKTAATAIARMYNDTGVWPAIGAEIKIKRDTYELESAER